MEQWRDVASQQAKLIVNRLNELLSNGLEFLRTELGVDLALKPELIPSWAILLAACTGLVLMLALWASMCRALFFKKRPAVTVVDDSGEVKRVASKAVKSEEPKKRKKKAEKKAQQNGRAVEFQEEDGIVAEERVPHHQPLPVQTKREKIVETKKSKKKAKQTVKETVTAAGKEPEEGTWETKVSNKEKREQRKKDKSSSDGSASPGGSGMPASGPPEQRKPSAAPPPANQKKKKGESSKVTAEKVDAIVSQDDRSDVALVAARGVTDSQAVKAVMVPPQTVVPKMQGPWTTTREPTQSVAAPLWRADIDDSWTVIDRVPADLNLMSFTKLGVGGAEPQLADHVPWLSHPKVDDEWTGFNGGSMDPSSDWSAPSEAWGNYEEPTPKPTPVQEQPESAKPNLLSATAENGETAADGAAKTKKKRKKKKKAAEEAGTTGQVEVPEKKAEHSAHLKKQLLPVQEPSAAVQPVKAAAVELRLERTVKENVSKKPLATQVPPKLPKGQATAPINLPPTTQQQKPEESQAAKPSKKKKARRET
ncbi:protein LYRIC-like isoform X2 [Dunckerocampus dactyliophorus]|uniref:protein LYRIC-like isoform X2 n=1 Tax=Dunckerocampus dactyliophorus TaxID=161453 RepID=UPI00240514FB|nr:protein LYRIC-like isoform X2 [Dunckerocampus dactyliophorus]